MFWTSIHYCGPFLYWFIVRGTKVLRFTLSKENKVKLLLMLLSYLRKERDITVKINILFCCEWRAKIICNNVAKWWDGWTWRCQQSMGQVDGHGAQGAGPTACVPWPRQRRQEWRVSIIKISTEFLPLQALKLKLKIYPGLLWMQSKLAVHVQHI